MKVPLDDREGGRAVPGVRARSRPPRVPARGRRSGEPWMAGAVILAVVVVAGVVGLVVVSRRGGPPPAAPPRVRRVDVVGDSLVHQASAPLRAKLVDAGFEATVVGLPSQSLSSGGVQTRLDDVAQLPADVLVIATTTNDVRDNFVIDGTRSSAPAYREQMTALLDRFGDRCVVVVNARDRTNAMFLPERAAVLNGELSRLELENDNMVLVDWATRSRDLPPEWFSFDQLHFGDGLPEEEAPDSASAREYADAIVGGVRRCADRSPR